MFCIQVVCVCVFMCVCVQLVSVSVFGVSQYCQLLAASTLSVCPRLCLLQLYYRDRPADLCTPKMASINSPFPHCCVKSRSVNNDAYIIMHCCYINQHCIVPSPSSVSITCLYLASCITLQPLKRVSVDSSHLPCSLTGPPHNSRDRVVGSYRIRRRASYALPVRNDKDYVRASGQS